MLLNGLLLCCHICSSVVVVVAVVVLCRMVYVVVTPTVVQQYPRTATTRCTSQWSSERHKEAAAHQLSHAETLLMSLIVQGRVVLLVIGLLALATTVGRLVTRNQNAGPSMVAQVHVALLLLCMLLILRSLGLHPLLLPLYQLLLRETDLGNGCACCCLSVAVLIVFVSSWGTWQQHCCVVGATCGC